MTSCRVAERRAFNTGYLGLRRGALGGFSACTFERHYLSRSRQRRVQTPLASLGARGLTSRLHHTRYATHLHPHSQPRALCYDTLHSVYCPTSCPYRSVCRTDAACSSNTIRDSISRSSVYGARAPRPPCGVHAARAASVRAYARPASRPAPAWYWKKSAYGT